MTQEQQTLLMIQGLVSQLPAAQKEACDELCEHIRMVIKQAGDPVGTMALCLVGAEAAAK